MSLRTPERKLSSAPRCDQPVQGGGMMSYHCSLPQGHDDPQPGVPDDDREPCYAVESDRSARLWSAWRERQEYRGAEPVAPEQHVIRCPTCGEEAMVVEKAGAKCEACGAEATFQPDIDPEDHPKPVEPTVEEVLADVPEDAKVLTEPTEEEIEAAAEWRRQAGLTSTETTPDPDVMAAAQAALAEPTGWSGGQPIPFTGDDAQTLRSLQGHVYEINVGVDGEPNTEVTPFEPTKQREGDQPLPSGGHRSVQDFKIAEEADRLGLDSEIVTQIMEESKRVGISRYGQTLHTFDGRKNIQDLADELRDSLVYVTKMQMTAEADRGVLIEMVTQALAREHEANGVDLEAMVIPVPEIAEIAVDRILDWVLTQRIGTDQVRPVDGE